MVHISTYYKHLKVHPESFAALAPPQPMVWILMTMMRLIALHSGYTAPSTQAITPAGMLMDVFAVYGFDYNSDRSLMCTDEHT